VSHLEFEFDGQTYEPALDQKRLSRMLDRVRDVLAADSEEQRFWWSLDELVVRCGGTPAAISARIRDLRKERNGSYNILLRRRKDQPGIWEYRMQGGAGSGVPEVVICPHCKMPISGEAETTKACTRGDMGCGETPCVCRRGW